MNQVVSSSQLAEQKEQDRNIRDSEAARELTAVQHRRAVLTAQDQQVLPHGAYITHAAGMAQICAFVYTNGFDRGRCGATFRGRTPGPTGCGKLQMRSDRARQRRGWSNNNIYSALHQKACRWIDTSLQGSSLELVWFLEVIATLPTSCMAGNCRSVRTGLQ
jgi:hypothetical protein